MAARTKKTTKKKAAPKKKVTTTAKPKEVVKAEPIRALSPFEEMEQVFDRAFERFFPRGWIRPSRWEFPHWAELPEPFEGKHPRVDVIDQDNDIVVKAEIPGVEKKDLDVSMTENTVTIKASVSHEKEESKGDYYRRELSSGSFSRTVALPGEIDGSKAEAKFKDGVL